MNKIISFLFNKFTDLVVAVFTIVLAISTIKLWQETRDLGKLGREEFISTHRPTILVRNFTLEVFQKDTPVCFRFMYINTGDTRANISSIEAKVLLLGPGVNKVPTNTNLIGGDFSMTSVNTGEFGISTIHDDLEPTEINIDQLNYPSLHVWVVGCINYTDDNGRIRRTGFARRKILVDGYMIFDKVPDDEYEYSY